MGKVLGIDGGGSRTRAALARFEKLPSRRAGLHASIRKVVPLSRHLGEAVNWTDFAISALLAASQ